MILETSTLYLATAAAFLATPFVARQLRKIIASDLCSEDLRIC